MGVIQKRACRKSRTSGIPAQEDNYFTYSSEIMWFKVWVKINVTTLWLTDLGVDCIKLAVLNKPCRFGDPDIWEPFTHQFSHGRQHSETKKLKIKK